ncbi:hypothetical protein J3R83DRAFT_1546 [Lanmaoa asiatica]|nr:hypothetical protein J3R83DRAFT_1546 [Lanmaoa asiatica]
MGVILSPLDSAGRWLTPENRGNLNLAEFRVAMGLNGDPIPDRLPPAFSSSSQDLDGFDDVYFPKNDDRTLSSSLSDTDSNDASGRPNTSNKESDSFVNVLHRSTFPKRSHEPNIAKR